MKKLFAENHSYTKNKVGIYISSSENTVETKFSDDTQDDLYSIEDTSWWFNYRAELIKRVADKFFSKEEMIVDIGGGNGFTTNYLRTYGYPVALVEPSYSGCVHGRSRGITNIVCDTINSSNIKEESISQCMALDVMEHIKDDKSFLKGVYRKMKRGSIFICTVPACNSLWSSEDDVAGHYRRYKKGEIKNKAEEFGFEVLFLSYFFGFLYFPVLIGRVWAEKLKVIKPCEERTEDEKKRIAKAQFQEKKGLINFILQRLEKLELGLLFSKAKIILGSSIICVLKKK